jgi:hypothetical protein
MDANRDPKETRYGRQHAGPIIARLCLGCALLFLQGCPSKPGPSGVRFPITNGFHTTLPPRDEPILIWSDPPLAEMAVEWLRIHHYSNLFVPKVHPVETPQIAHNFSTRTAGLAVAREMKAALILVVEHEATKDGALIETDCGPLFNVHVEARGLSTETGDTVLRGGAHYPQCVDLNGKTLRSLACQAFATAWGFRPSGQLDVPSSLMCTAGQTEATPVR